MRYAYRHLDWRELANELARRGQFDDLLRHLMLQVDGDVEGLMQALGRDAAKFRRQTGMGVDEFERRLRESGLVGGKPGERALTAKGERRLREGALEDLFGRVKAGGAGGHPLPRQSGRGEPNGVLRPWNAGDESLDIAYRESFLGMLRGGRSDLADQDLVVHEREATGACAWVLGIDISHSMTLYGEDRITPAKQVAMAFAELVQRRYRHDSLDIILFGDDVREVAIKDLPYISNGPFHTNTCEALRRAGELLLRRHQPTRKVVLITDGKPTALFTGRRTADGERELEINSSYGLDPAIVAATLNQAARYPRAGIDLTVVMVADDPYLQRFVQQLVEVSRGEAFHARAADLGKQLLARLFGKRSR